MAELKYFVRIPRGVFITKNGGNIPPYIKKYRENQ